MHCGSCSGVAIVRTGAALFLAAGLSASALAAPVTSTAQAKALVMQPVTLTNTQALSFGSFTAGAAGGTVIIDADTGARAVSGGVTAMGGEITAAIFQGNASGNKHVRITVPKTAITLTRIGGGGTMLVDSFTLDGKKNDKVPVNQKFIFQVGGRLLVNANQPDGSYEGSFDIIADYQ